MSFVPASGGYRLPIFAGTPYIQEVLLDAPEAFYMCQEVSGFLQDSSGNGHNFNATNGSPTYQQSGPSANVKGIKYTSAGLDNSQGPVVLTTTGNLALEFWYNPAVLGDSNHSIVGNNNVGTNGYEVITPTPGKFAVVCQNVAIQANSAISMSTGNWYHIVISRASGIWTYYVNGSLDTANAGTSNPFTPSGTTSINRDTGGDFSLAMYALYTNELSPARVDAHYKAIAL